MALSISFTTPSLATIWRFDSSASFGRAALHLPAWSLLPSLALPWLWLWLERYGASRATPINPS